MELEGLVEEMKGKMAKLEERATQREVLLGQVEGELAKKVETFTKTEEGLTMRGSKTPLLSLPACILRWILPLLVSPSASLMGNSCHENDSSL